MGWGDTVDEGAIGRVSRPEICSERDKRLGEREGEDRERERERERGVALCVMYSRKDN